jgi:chorismate mutase
MSTKLCSGNRNVNQPSNSFNDSLLEYRAQLDAIDAQLISLLAVRFSITSKIGELKARHHAPAADPSREAAQLERLLARSNELGLAREFIQAVYETLFSLVRKSHAAAAGHRAE